MQSPLRSPLGLDLPLGAGFAVLVGPRGLSTSRLPPTRLAAPLGAGGPPWGPGFAPTLVVVAGEGQASPASVLLALEWISHHSFTFSLSPNCASIKIRCTSHSLSADSGFVLSLHSSQPSRLPFLCWGVILPQQLQPAPRHLNRPYTPGPIPLLPQPFLSYPRARCCPPSSDPTSSMKTSPSLESETRSTTGLHLYILILLINISSLRAQDLWKQGLTWLEGPGLGRQEELTSKHAHFPPVTRREGSLTLEFSSTTCKTSLKILTSQACCEDSIK